jgi:uncharacterized protein
MISQIKEDMKQAMKDKNKVKLSTLRMLLATLENERIKLKVEELNEEQIITCINRNLKQLGQEIDSLTGASRDIDNQLKQKEVLMSYLPEQLTEEEIRYIVIELSEMVKTYGGNFGELMKKLSSLKGEADMRLVSKIAKEVF